ncbi:hypothetical protein [Chitinilyticum litopenaei]|uniref:hypothetical protein n=1 Tax=Chitinilyticum litopenaei TaxID=1121276 RepID=UPI00118674DB|nr:hypothetical protein [Chitinilyticum litopenaei]
MENTLYICCILALGLVLYVWRQRVKRWNDLYRIQREAELAELNRDGADGLPEIEIYAPAERARQAAAAGPFTIPDFLRRRP